MSKPVFAHRTTTPIALDAPLCIDISGIGESDQKLQAAVESKQLPDITQVDDGRFTAFASSGIFTDHSELFAEVGKQWGGWYKPAERIPTKDGKFPREENLEVDEDMAKAPPPKGCCSIS